MSVTRTSLLGAAAGAKKGKHLCFEAPSLLGGSGISESLFESNPGDKGAAKNFKVVVRVRPHVERESGAAQCLQIQSSQVIAISKPTSEETEDGKTHSFPFDRIFDDATPQAALYDLCVKPVVLSILEGYNGSIIAYGQTGTGKTFTIEGEDGEARGIIPRTSEEIFAYIENASETQSKFLVRASFLQIYNETITDLLDADQRKGTKKHLHIREDVSGGVYVDGLTEHIVKGSSEILELLRLGSSMRTTASTNMNRESSRSHAVFTVIVERSEKSSEESSTVTIGKLSLVDLAGSERIRNTGVSTGARLDEMKNINKSLSAFGKVILALTSPGNHHVPYRDSKLTRILQGSLGGNCRTTMITTITSAADSYQETLNSLKFAKRAKNVKNFAIVNQDLSEQALLTAYEREIARLRRELEENKKVMPALPTAPVVDQGMIDMLKQQHAALAAEKDQIQNELEQRAQEVAQALEEKRRLTSRLSALERQLLIGGTKVEDHPQFHAALQEVELKLKKEYENRFEALERERERLTQEKAQFEREKTMFSRRRSEVSLSAISAISTQLSFSVSDSPDADALLPSPAAAVAASGSPSVVTVGSTSAQPSAASSSSPFAASTSMPNVAATATNGRGSGASTTTNGSASTITAPTAAVPRSLSPLRPQVVRVGAILGSADSTGAAARAGGLSPSAVRRAHRQQQPTPDGSSNSSSPAPADEDPPPLLTRQPTDASNAPGVKAPAAVVAVKRAPASPRMARAPEQRQPEAWIPAEPEPDTAPPTPAHAASSTATPRDYGDEQFNAVLESYLQALRDPETGVVTHDRRVDHQLVRGVFSGLDAADWFVGNMHGVTTLDEAQAVGQKFLALGLLTPVNCGPLFEPTDQALYKLPEFDSRASTKQPPAPRAAAAAAPVAAAPLPATPTHSLASSVSSSTLGDVLARSSSTQQPSSSQQAARVAPRVSPPTSQQQPPPQSQQLLQAQGSMRRVSSNGVLSTTPTDANAALAAAGSLLQRYASAPANATAAPTGMIDFEDMNAEEEYGATLLHSAAGQGDRTAMKTFLQTFSVDCPDRMGRTPLMYASIGNRVKAIEFLLKQNATAHTHDSNGRTSLLWAAYYGHVEVVRLLLKHDTSLVELPDPDGRTALHWSTKHESTKCLDLLLRVATPGIINAQDNEQVTALHWAVLCQHPEHTQHLIKVGADPRIVDMEGRTALHYAVSNTTARCLKVLLESAPEELINARDGRGRAALHLAISAEASIEIVMALLGSLVCDVNCTDGRMTTPLHWAAVCNRPDICKALCQRGAVLSFRDTNGMTPLHYAIQKGYTDCAAVLQKMATLATQKRQSHAEVRPMSALTR